jgi:PKD repeat protein
MRVFYRLLFIIFVPVIFLFALFAAYIPLLQATTGSGNLVINEIMYNPIGSDTNHEWIEIWNKGPSNINLTGFKLYEASTNHSLNIYQGSLNIPSNGYAILTASGSVFLQDHPFFSGTIIDTSFSLSNTGELLSIKDNTGTILDTISYQNTWGGDGNGKTLERDDLGHFIESLVVGGTPGYQNSVYNQNTNAENENINNNGSDNTNININDNINGNNNENINSNNGNENDNINQNANCQPLLGDVVINEIFPAPSSNSNTSEWIELYNKKDCTIDLSGWNIDDASHSPKTLSGSILPAQYVVLQPSPITLNNRGDQVILKKGDTVIDEMCYGNVNGCLSPAPLPTYNQSLGRFPNGKDTDQGSDFKIFGVPTKGSENTVNNHSPIAVLDLQYPYKTVGNAPFSVNVTGERSYDLDHDALLFSWDFGDGFTTSDKNPLAHKYYRSGSFKISLTVSDQWDGHNTASLYITVLPPTTGSSRTTSFFPVCTTKESSARIELSEFLPNPAGPDSENEFIEIVNHDTKPVNLCGWQLDDQEGGSKPYMLGNIIIQQGQYLVFYSKETKLALNNDEDDVRLIDPWGKIIEQVHYKNPPKNKSYAKVKKEKTAYNQQKLLASIDLSVGLDNTPYVWVWSSPTPEQPNDTPVLFQGIVINELLPDPKGTDTEGEFIELNNTTENPIDLQGWQLSDASGKTYTFKDSTNINANGFLVIFYNQSQMTLNNDTDTIQLVDNKGGIQDQISYKDSVEGKSYSRFINNPSYPQDSTWEWSIPTPNAENEREKLYIQAEPAGGIYYGPISVSLIANQPNTKIFYSFSGDATPDEQMEYTHPIVLRSSSELWFFGFTDENNATPIKTERYTIERHSLTATGSVIISESYPNPEKADQGKEWIELRNVSVNPVDISNWYITNKLHQKIFVPDHTVLDSSAYYILTWHDTAFHLINTSDILSLYNKEGTWQDEMQYNHVKTKQSIVRIEQNGLIYNISTPSDFPTPGEQNIDRRVFHVPKTIKKTVSHRKTSTYHTISAISADSAPSSIQVNRNVNKNNINNNYNNHEDNGNYTLPNIKNTAKADIMTSINTPYATYLLLGIVIFSIGTAVVFFFYHKK